MTPSLQHEKDMDGQLIILGCGASAGVPTIGNYWGACDPAEPRNVRTRASVALKTAKTFVLIDTGPDLRQQMLRENLDNPDAIIITHNHSDHINGIDDLRIMQRRHKRLYPIYAMDETFASFDSSVHYMFESSEDGFYPPVCERAKFTLLEPFTVGDITMLPFEQDHGSIHSLGLRIGNIAYSTDVKHLKPDAMNALKGIDTWIVDGAGHHTRENPVHACIEEVIEMNDRIGARRVILTHLPPTMDYRTLADTLPDGYEPAHDGMRIDFSL